MSREATHAQAQAQAQARRAMNAPMPRAEADQMLDTASLELNDAELTLFTARHRLGAAVNAARLSAIAVCGFSGLDFRQIDSAGELEVLLAAADLLELSGAWRADAIALQRPARIDDEEAGHAIVWATEIHVAARLYVMGGKAGA